MRLVDILRKLVENQIALGESLTSDDGITFQVTNDGRLIVSAGDDVRDEGLLLAHPPGGQAVPG